MRKNKLLFAFFLVFFIAKTTFSQSLIPNTGFCGNAGTSDWFNWYRQHRDQLAQDRSGDTTWLYVPMTVHIVGETNGTGYWPMEFAIVDVCEMNQKYAPSHIRFYLADDVPFHYIANSTWYKHDFDNGAIMIDENNIPNRANAYVVADPAGNCGYQSWLDAIVLGKNCSNSGNITWAHEMGHLLSLPHTFLGWEGTNYNDPTLAPETINGANVEFLDGSNCKDAGDFFCDTRADYLSYRWACNPNAESVVTLTDPTGAAFHADGTNYMSYALDNCGAGFSAEQTQAMRDNLGNQHQNYIQTTTLGTMLPDDAQVSLASPIDTQVVQYNNIVLNWHPVKDATIYIVEVSNSPVFNLLKLTYGVIKDTTLNITKSIPNNNKIYWRVRAYNNWDLCQPHAVQQVGVFKTKNVLSTNSFDRVAEVTLLTNPVAGGNVSTLRVETDETFDAVVSVSDYTGRIIATQTHRIQTGENLFPIETGRMAAGIYNVALQTAFGSIVKKLVVME